MPTSFELFNRNAWLNGLLEKIEAGKKRPEPAIPSRSPSPIIEGGNLVGEEDNASSEEAMHNGEEQGEGQGFEIMDGQSEASLVDEFSDEGDKDGAYGDHHLDDDLDETVDEEAYDSDQGKMFDAGSAVTSDIVEQALQNTGAYIADAAEVVSRIFAQNGSGQ
jgi:hypothetical protein